MTLVHKLWTFCPQDLTNLSGDAQKIRERVLSLASTHGLSLSERVRKVSSGSKQSDPLLGMDPWAMGRSQAKGQTGINDEDAATSHERLCLLSTFVDSNGSKIAQVPRWEVASSAGGGMFVSASNYAATLALTEHVSPLIMVFDKLEGTGLRPHEVTKTQLLVGTRGRLQGDLSYGKA